MQVAFTLTILKSTQANICMNMLIKLFSSNIYHFFGLPRRPLITGLCKNSCMKSYKILYKIETMYYFQNVAELSYIYGLSTLCKYAIYDQRQAINIPRADKSLPFIILNRCVWSLFKYILPITTKITSASYLICSNSITVVCNFLDEMQQSLCFFNRR